MSTSRSSRTDTLCSLQDISDSVDSYANSDLDLPGAGGAEGGTCSTLPADHHTSLQKKDDTLALCDFDCGPPMPRRDMVNKGNSRSQCWVCKPCHCSMTAIIRSWSKNPDTKAMLDHMRAKDKRRWQALVRQCRIRESVEEVGLPDVRARKRQVLESTRSMLQSFGIRDMSDVLWLTQSRYIAHQIYVEGIQGTTFEQKEAAALAKWQRDFANPDVVRRGVGADTQLAVFGVPRTQAFRTRASRDQISCTDTVLTSSAMDATLTRLAEHGTSAQSFTGPAMAGFGEVFQHGRTSSSLDTLPSSLPPCTACAPPSSALCDPTVFEPPLGLSATHRVSDKRPLARMDSDTSKRAKGRCCWQALGHAHGGLRSHEGNFPPPWRGKE